MHKQLPHHQSQDEYDDETAKLKGWLRLTLLFTIVVITLSFIWSITR